MQIPKILIVEDDRDLLLLLEKSLQKAGYEVISVTSGCPIVNRQCVLPDLFIIDKTLNIIDGIALCKFLRINEITRDIPIIMISGDPEVQKRAIDIGADYFMHKPLSIGGLLNIIKILTLKQLDSTKDI
jgi:DNA-binding response OmpR family regulator